ncbi:MAG: hypothetical protein ACHQ03_06940 [Candidatus Bathyarchaeia archaeon]
MFNLAKRFSIGIDVDDPWTYAGLKAPKSIMFPHYISKRLDGPGMRLLKKMSEREPPTDDYVVSKADSQEACSSLAEHLVAAKISFVRCWFPWRFFEDSPKPESEVSRPVDESNGEFPMDTFVDVLTARGIGVLPVVCCGYQRFLPHGLKVDSDRNAFVRRAAAHARLLVRKYKDKIRFWQIENEPNWWHMHSVGGWREGSTWLNTDFKLQLLKELNDAVHVEDTAAWTIINLEADAKLAKIGHFAAQCDMIGLDFYPNYKQASPIDVSIFRKAKTVAEKTGKPAMIIETGYPSGPALRGYSTAKQAEYVRKACSEALAIEALNAIGIWRYSDSAWRSFPLIENHFGLIDHQGRPKLAWNAISEAAHNLIA